MPALVLAFAAFACLASALVSAYAIGFIADLPWLPRTIDSGAPADTATALAIDLALVALFGLQHSVMARRGFKQRLARWWPAGSERSVYVLLSALVLALLMGLWHPLPAPVWQVHDTVGVVALWGLFALGWLLMLVASFQLDPLELFGLRQAWCAAKGRVHQPQPFRTPGLYRAVRHPIYAGFLLAFWAAPAMSQGRLLFAAAMTAYVFIGIAFEERDLVAQFGETYRAYRQRVPMVLPGWWMSGKRSRR